MPPADMGSLSLAAPRPVHALGERPGLTLGTHSLALLLPNLRHALLISGPQFP